MASSTINAIGPAFQPLVTRSLERLDTKTTQTGNSLQQRGLQNLKTITGPSPVDTAADVGTYTPAVTGSVVDVSA